MPALVAPRSPRRPPRRPRAAGLLALLAAAGLLAGCRIDLGASLVVERDGSGTAGLEIVLDADAVAQLDELALDPFADLAAAAVDTPDWDVERASTDDGGERVRLSTAAADPAALTAALRELSSGLSPDDPSFDLDLELAVADDGATQLHGEVGLRPPTTAGARRDGQPLGPAGDELAALVADAVSARFEVSLPGRVTDHDADAVDAGSRLLGGGSRLTWDVPVGATRSITASAAAPPLVAPWLVAAGAGVVAVLLVAAAWWWRRRRAR